jgi:ADP-ribose pyrophosphatase YjhB (NUDIX family)
MSFPGGKQDMQDISLEETALRECEEELGISRENIRVLGSFDDHITPRRFIITPIVAFIDQSQELFKCDEEVHEILKIPVDFFTNKKNYRERTYKLNNDTIGVGKYNYRDTMGNKYVIFGATCHIIVHYVDLVHNAGLMKPGVRRLSPPDVNIRDNVIKKE